jgi:HEAT repeat protein
MEFRRKSTNLTTLSRWPYVVVGILAFILGLFAGKLNDSHRAPLREKNDLDLRIDAEIKRVLSQETASLTHESWSLAMESLVEIGKRGVPKLLETIEKARDLASSDAGGAKPSGFYVETQTRIIQTRAVMILGQIGDARALPVLYKLRAEDELCPLRCEVDYAVKNIGMRQARIPLVAQ